MDAAEFFNSLIPGLLFALVVLAPLFLKRLVETYAEKVVGSVFDERLEKYKSELSRAATAREILFQREIAFYDKADAQIAELVPLIQDLRDNLVEQPFTKKKRDYFTRLLELIMEMKDVSLRYEAYIQRDIWDSFNSLVVELQVQQTCWFEYVKMLSEESEISDEDKATAEDMCNQVLWLVAQVRVQQATYLKTISGGGLL